MREDRRQSESATIRPATIDDAAGIAAIYNPHVTGTIVTFEEDAIDPAEMAGRIATIGAHFPWLVLEDCGAVAGYAYGSPWKTRSGYRFTVETTIYLAESHLGAGLGLRLYGRLLDELRDCGFHVAVGCIALPNDPSVGLHERLGFARVAEFPAVGWKLGRWIDVGYWQLRLRSGAPV